MSWESRPAATIPAWLYLARTVVSWERLWPPRYKDIIIEVFPLNLVAERCGGIFDDIDKVISASERQDFMAKYKRAAGFAKDNLNSAPPTVQLKP